SSTTVRARAGPSTRLRHPGCHPPPRLAFRAGRCGQVRFGILGPREATDGDRLLGLGGPNSRSLLACLLVRANEVVPADSLVAAVWPRQRPARAAASLQTPLTRLRGV